VLAVLGIAVLGVIKRPKTYCIACFRATPFHTYVEVFWRLGYDVLLYIGIFWRFEAQQYESADAVVGVGEPHMSIWSLDIYVDDTCNTLFLWLFDCLMSICMICVKFWSAGRSTYGGDG